MKKIIVIATLTVVVAVGAVWKFSGESAPDMTTSVASLADHSDHLSLIPADTLFYVGGLKPIAATDMMASMASMYQFADPEIWSQINQQTMDEFNSKADTDGSKFAVSLFKFFMQGLNDPQAMFEQTGAKDTLFTSMYSVGLMPVIRFEADQSRFEQFLAQLEADAQIKALMKEAGGVSYRAYPLAGDANKGLDLVAAYHQGDAIFTLAVNGLIDQQALLIALGAEKPVQSLKSAGTVPQLKDEYAYLPDSLGYLSFQQIITSLTSSDNMAGQMLFALDEDMQDKMAVIRSPECAAEFAEITTVWPRWVMGYRTLDYSDKGFSGDFHMNVEIKHTGLTDVLQQISGHLPADLDREQADIFSLAIGLDVSRLDSIIGGMAKLAEGFQYRCELLQDLNGTADAIHSARPAVAMSTGMARGLKGLRASLYDLQGDLTSGEVTAVDALVSLSGEQVRALLNIMMAMNPDGGMVTIPEDGSPVALPMPPQLAQGAANQIQAMLAAKNDHAVIFTGDKAASFYAEVLDEPLNENGFLFFSMDYGKYMKLFGSFMDVAAQNNAEMSDDDRAGLEAFRNAMESLNYHETVRMRFTGKGVEFDGKIEIKNP